MRTRLPRVPAWSVPALLGALLAGCAAPGGRGPELALESEPLRLPAEGALAVERSLRVAPGEYVRPSGGEQGVIHIQGRRDVVVDLAGVRLLGQRPGEPLDQAQGLGLVIEDCDRVTVRGGELGGFLGCVVVRNSTEVVLEDMRFESYRAERLRGTASALDTVDLVHLEELSPIGWFERYGAAVTILDSRDVTVRRCTARNGQNGVLVLRSEGCEVYENDLSFLSGWGVALAGSSDNRVSHNRLDFIARTPASGGPGEGYNGAGVLLTHRSSRNTVAWNSATRSGYGALIGGSGGPDAGAAGSPLAGSGSDDNLFYRNDFSHTVGPGLFALGGRGTWVVANEFGGNPGGGVRARSCVGWVIYANELNAVPGTGVSLEGSRECLVVGNTFEGCDRALQVRPLDLVTDDAAPEATASDPSGKHWLLDNLFRSNLQDLVLEQARDLVAAGNRFESSRPDVHLFELTGAGSPDATPEEVWGWLAGVESGTPSGRAWRSSLRRDVGEAHPWLREIQRFSPPSVPGASLGPVPGAPPGLEGLVLGAHGPWDFNGPAPRPEPAAFGGLLAGVEWDAVWFRFDSSSDPRGDLDAWRALAFEPLHRARVERWIDPWGDARAREVVGAAHFGLIATAQLRVPESGLHHLSILSDDGARLSVDGRVVYEDWTWHPARRDSATFDLEAGTHELRLEYFQLEGAAALALDIAPAQPRFPQTRLGRAPGKPLPAATDAAVGDSPTPP